MSLSVNQTNYSNYKPAFGAGKNPIRKGNFCSFVRQQSLHFGIQAGSFALLNASKPHSQDLETFLAIKLGCDIGEAFHTILSLKMPFDINHQCSNPFAYLADGTRAVTKFISSKMQK